MSAPGRMSRTTGASSSKHGGGGSLYQCDVCGKDFPFKVVLDMHKKDHAFKNVFKCDVCGTAYPKKSQLDMHYRKHTGERPFKCDECDSSFMNSSNLQRHKRKHVCKRRYDSDEWEAAYTLSDNLSAEKKARGGGDEDGAEKPYSCTDCGETFPKMNTLMVHKRKHSGERPYACDECGASFAVRASLDYHKLKHAGGESSYWHNVCDVCGDAFTSKDGLVQHQRKHTAARPFNYDRYFAAFTAPDAPLPEAQQVMEQPMAVQPVGDAQQLPQQHQTQVELDSEGQYLTQHPADHHPASPMTLQLHELQPSPQLHQLNTQPGTHIQIPSNLQHPGHAYPTPGDQDQVVPGPMGPQAQPVQQEARHDDPHDVNIKEEPRE